MRYLSMIRVDETRGVAPSEQLMQDMGKLIEEMTRKGHLISTAGLRPSAEGVRIRLRGGKLSTTDGPFAETKEVIGGFAVFELPDMAAAVESARRFMQLHVDHMPGWEGSIEIRPVAGSKVEVIRGGG